MGLEFSFSPDQIAVRNVDPATVDGLSQSLPLGLRMMQLLKGGPMTIAAIAEQLDAKGDTVKKAVQRSPSLTKVLSADGITRIALVERRIA